ncbi:hypothetical protein OAF74_02765 [bacterium]|nr:hypothetical protein [bacterium]
MVFSHKNRMQGGRSMRDGFAVALRNLKSGELPLSTLISQEMVDEACTQAGYLTRAILYTPLTTILTFVA